MYLSPSIYFTLAWLISFSLVSIGIAKILIDISAAHIALMSCILFCGLISAFLAFEINRSTNAGIVTSYLRRNESVTMKAARGTGILFLGWVSLVIFHIYSFKGQLPVFNSIPYYRFIIQPLTGLMNSLSILLFSVFFTQICWRIRYFKSIRRTSNFLVCCALILLWSVVQMNRQVFVGMSLIALLVTFRSMTSIKRKLSFILLGSLALLFCFGLLGLKRGGSVMALAGIDQWPSYIPEAFVWPYIYIATPANNLLHNVQNYPLFNSGFECVLSDLVPSFIRSFFQSGCGTGDFSLVTADFNVATIFAGLFLNLGIIGGLLVMLLTLILVDLSYLNFCRQEPQGERSIWKESALNILIAGLILTTFSNLIFHVVYAYAIVLCLFLEKTSEFRWRLKCLQVSP